MSIPFVMENLPARATACHARAASLLAICKRRAIRKGAKFRGKEMGAKRARKNVPAKWQELHVTSPNFHQR
jgi:hypothetical protein